MIRCICKGLSFDCGCIIDCCAAAQVEEIDTTQFNLSYGNKIWTFDAEDFEIDASKIADTTAIQMLREIQKVIHNEKYSDFDAIEEIVCIFERYEIDAGFRHDF